MNANLDNSFGGVVLLVGDVSASRLERHMRACGRVLLVDDAILLKDLTVAGPVKGQPRFLREVLEEADAKRERKRLKKASRL